MCMSWACPSGGTDSRTAQLGSALEREGAALAEWGSVEYLVSELSQACFVSYPEKALGTRLSLLAHLILGISHSVYRRQIYY